jgi:hypothetical protein
MRIDSKLNSKALTGAGTNITFERGTIQLEPNRKAVALMLKLTIPVQNTTGGALALSDANRQLLFSLFTLTLTVGMKSKVLQQPFVSHDFRRVHHAAREYFNDEIKGYTDSTNGLATSIANGATTNLVVFLPIPTGVAWFNQGKFRNMWGMGPTQCKLTEVFIRQTGTAIAANWAVNGNVTVELEPYVVPCKGDQWSPLPIYEEKDEVNKLLDLPPGLPLYIHERTQVQASDPLTNLSLYIDGEKAFQQLAANDRACGIENAWQLTASGYVSDRETVIYEQTDGETSFETMRTGAPRLVQDTKDLATFKAAYGYVPVLDPEAIAQHIDYIAKTERKANVKAVSYADVQRLDVPDCLRPFMPFVLVGEQDKEFEQFAGIVGYVDATPPKVVVPETLLKRVKASAAVHAANGEKLAAADVGKRVAAMVPGAVDNARGFSKGNSSVLNTVRRFIGG